MSVQMAIKVLITTVVEVLIRISSTLILLSKLMVILEDVQVSLRC